MVYFQIFRSLPDTVSVSFWSIYSVLRRQVCDLGLTPDPHTRVSSSRGRALRPGWEWLERARRGPDRWPSGRPNPPGLLCTCLEKPLASLPGGVLPSLLDPHLERRFGGNVREADRAPPRPAAADRATVGDSHFCGRCSSRCPATAAGSHGAHRSVRGGVGARAAAHLVSGPSAVSSASASLTRGTRTPPAASS